MSGATIRFTKMHGLGNDFIVFDAIHQPIQLNRNIIRRLSDRHMGIGCDQLLLVEKAQAATADFRYRIFNADGEEVEQCGNGARCFARFVLDKGLTSKKTIVVETMSGLIHLSIQSDGQVSVDMGHPRFKPCEIPYKVDEEALFYLLPLDEKQCEIGAVSMGNPHAILKVEKLDSHMIGRIGPQIEKHPLFPNRVNVGFMKILTPDHIQLRVYERGAGETLACGSGACAAVAYGRRRGWLDKSVKVDLPGGQLLIEWPEKTGSIIMTGPVATTFEGTIDYESFSY